MAGILVWLHADFVSCCHRYKHCKRAKRQITRFLGSVYCVRDRLALLRLAGSFTLAVRSQCEPQAVFVARERMVLNFGDHPPIGNAGHLSDAHLTWRCTGRAESIAHWSCVGSRAPVTSTVRGLHAHLHDRSGFSHHT